MGKLKFSPRRKGQLVVLYQAVTDHCCGLAVIFCSFISHLIGGETINIPEIFSGIHSFTGKTVSTDIMSSNFDIHVLFHQLIHCEHVIV